MDKDKFDSCIDLLKKSDTMTNVLSELSQQSQQSDVFEPEIKFPPSYKFVNDIYSIAGSDKKRIPGYADRILFKRGENKRLISNTDDYQLITSATISDHKPVTCSFNITLPNNTKPKVRIITWNIGSGDNGKSADEMITALLELLEPYGDCEYIVITLQEANDDLYRALEKTNKMREHEVKGVTSALSSSSILFKKIYYKLVTIILEKSSDVQPVGMGGSPVIENFNGILNNIVIEKSKIGLSTKGAFNTILAIGDTGARVYIINLHFPFDNSITYNHFKTQLNALFKALDNSGEWCIMAGDYNSRSNIILDKTGNPIPEIRHIFDGKKLNAIFGKGLQVHPIEESSQETKPKKFVPPTGYLEAYQGFCNKLYNFYSTQQQQQLTLPPLPPNLLALLDKNPSTSGGSKLRKTRKYKKIIRKKNKKHTNKYKKHKYILRKRTNKKRKH